MVCINSGIMHVHIVLLIGVSLSKPHTNGCMVIEIATAHSVTTVGSLGKLRDDVKYL